MEKIDITRVVSHDNNTIARAGLAVPVNHVDRDDEVSKTREANEQSVMLTPVDRCSSCRPCNRY